jgi:hypothetical protein
MKAALFGDPTFTYSNILDSLLFHELPEMHIYLSDYEKSIKNDYY